MATIIEHWTTRGGKYSVKLMKDSDGTYSVRYFDRDKATGDMVAQGCSVGWEHLADALNDLNKSMYLNRYFDGRNFNQKIA